MARSWTLASCVLLISLYVSNAIQQQQRIQNHKNTQDLAQTKLLTSEGFSPGLDRVKRKTDECHVFETKDGSGLQKIVDTSGETQTFFIQPQPGFSRLIFQVKVNNKFSPSPWKYFDRTLDVSSSRLNINWSHPAWIPVQVAYFKNEVSFRRDRHAIRVKVGENVNEVLLTKWWRTHSYEGFTIYAEGPLKVLFNCNSQTKPAEFLKQEEEKIPVQLILGLLGVCCLLAVGAAIVYFITVRCARTRLDRPPTKPEVPKSLLFKRHNHREKDSDPIYETIDETTLAKLRQNLDSEILSRPQGERDLCGSSAAGLREDKKEFCGQTLDGECPSSKIPGDTAEGMPGLSLLEEKLAHRHAFGLDSPVENHYVEMHGIVSRTSSLNK